MNPEAIAIEKLKTLSRQDQQEVLNFIEFLHSKASAHFQAPPPTEHPISLLETGSKWIGSVEGPGDLSTNERYMEGFGQ